MDINSRVIAALVLLCSMAILKCESANILVMLPLPVYSHTIAYMPIIKELAKKGHNITMVSPYPQEKKIPNINDVVVPALYKEITDPSMFVLSKRNVLDDMKIFWRFGFKAAEVALKQEPVRRIMSAPSDSFDLIMMETFFLLEPMAALQHKFKCPIVNLHPWSLNIPIAYFTGNPILSSFIPSLYSSYSDEMSFLQRTRNVLLDTFELAGLHLYYLPRQDETMRKLLGDLLGFENLPYISELLRKTSLSLIDTHHALDFKKPYFRNVVEIGGLTIHNKQQVSKELQKYMDESTQGFIYFSLGSHLPASMLPETFKADLFKAFGKLKENVIMKWENVDDVRSKNVRIEKWLPQLEVLSHPNCKLFITHGGLHAIQEATYYKVPLIGIPLVSDQPMNIRFVQHIGLGLKIDVFETTEEQLVDAITTVITDTKYKNVAIERSSLLKDNAINTVDNAVYHVEYVLRHKGVNLQPPTLQISWYQLLLLDVMILLVTIVSLAIITVLALVRFIILILRWSKKGKKTKHAKKQ